MTEPAKKKKKLRARKPRLADPIVPSHLPTIVEDPWRPKAPVGKLALRHQEQAPEALRLRGRVTKDGRVVVFRVLDGYGKTLVERSIGPSSRHTILLLSPYIYYGQLIDLTLSLADMTRTDGQSLAGGKVQFLDHDARVLVEFPVELEALPSVEAKAEVVSETLGYLGIIGS